MKYLPLIIAAAAAVVVWFVLNNLLFAGFVALAVAVAAYFYVPSFKTFVLGLVGLAEKEYGVIIGKITGPLAELEAFVVQEEQKAVAFAEQALDLTKASENSKAAAAQAKKVVGNVNTYILGKSS